ncbi:flagellar hook capping FlgD N-terminal domain-containing protein [Hydrogenobacter sp. T-2]|uniref:flagellar hook assembly protein FlgD n=1 Tax=Pampinifervens diazotrophicum TaxID=1632018 RepID=UPI002B257706|nr:flagellar hook capping FlgD N-terminal domain-containing protein [Hydrogenobacter sp. T-2]WPM31942.1 flagellar hook capping FlgD N-terminal domain-containing protein [Hydrogenobacter sp. T-2]
MAELRGTNPYHIKPPEPKVLPKNYTQGVDNLSSEDFLKIYIETLRYQDPFQPQDLSKMLEDMTRLNQIRYMNDMKSFMEGLKGWFNQITLLSSLSLIDKEFVFSTNKIDTLKGGQYYLLSSEDIKGATIRIMDGDDVIKEYQVDINKGLNPIELSDLPKGHYSVQILKNGMPVDSLNLGVMGKIKSVSVSGGELLFELENGELVSPSRLIYAGGM